MTSRVTHSRVVAHCRRTINISRHGAVDAGRLSMVDDHKTVSQGDRALTLGEAKTLYGIPEHRLRQARRERSLDFFKIGRAVFVSERSLREYLDRHRVPAVPSQHAGKLTRAKAEKETL